MIVTLKRMEHLDAGSILTSLATKYRPFYEKRACVTTWRMLLVLIDTAGTAFRTAVRSPSAPEAETFYGFDQCYWGSLWIVL